ncbi:hypothetical protein M422DRAFT_261855 [Sphaerobolus stellatus SS14]|uniref:Uncharacterized protein n=1 Tax=Sphaerobolus stellatus (strain SS14) TaxID=990650 RepID=A0A0C9UM54_SPHS4|nr:hypothetical protein M422DRAFT_261855 [Sphaerobolus stellatus SS14]
MSPSPYNIEAPALSVQDDFLIFSTSQTIIQSLRSRQKILTFLVALSAFVASLRPLLNRVNGIAGIVLAAVGITAGLVSLLTVLIDWMLRWIEANAAKHRQGAV